MKQTRSAARSVSRRGLNLQASITAGPVRSWLAAAVVPPVDRLPAVLLQGQQQAVLVRSEKPADSQLHLHSAAA